MDDDDFESSKLSNGLHHDKKQSISSKPVFHYQSAPARDKNYKGENDLENDAKMQPISKKESQKSLKLD